MDIISAYREVGTYRGAAALSGTTAKTVKRAIAHHESGGATPARVPRGRNYDAVTELVAHRVERSKARISAKRLLPAARAAGMDAITSGRHQHREFRLIVRGPDVGDDPAHSVTLLHDLHRSGPGSRLHLPDERHPPMLPISAPDPHIATR